MREVVVTAGGMVALVLACQATVGAGDSAVVLTPLWPNVAAAVRVAGAEAIEVPLALTDGRIPPRPRPDRGRHQAQHPAPRPGQPRQPHRLDRDRGRLAEARRPLRAPRPLAPRRRRLRADRLRGQGGPKPPDDPRGPTPDDHRPELLEDLPDDRLAGRLRDRPARAGPGDDEPAGVRRQPRPRDRPGGRAGRDPRRRALHRRRPRPATPGTAGSPSTDSARSTP